MTSPNISQAIDNDNKLIAGQIQQRASDPAYSVYISASAGTGKTKVLIDRILRLLLSGSHPSNILCLTFTTAAADEVITRLKKKLSSWVTLTDSELSIDLENLGAHSQDLGVARQLYGIFLDNLENIKIQTLHAFCSKILTLSATLTENFDAQVNIIDFFTKEQLAQQAYANLLYTAHLDAKLEENIKKLTSIKDHETLLRDALHAIDVREVSHIVAGDADIDIFNFFQADKNLEYDELYSKKISELGCEIHQSLVDFSTFGKMDQKIINTLKEWNKADIEERLRLFDSYSKAFLTLEKIPRKKLLTNDIAKKYPEFIETLAKEQELIYSTEKILANQRIAESSAAMLVFVERLDAEIEALKKKHNYAEYDDLLLQTFRLLHDSEDKAFLLYKLDSIIDHILVDEAQDLNQIQWDLIKLLTEDFFAGLSAKDSNRTIFIVGDFKQSIFGFHGAQPQIFQDIKDFYREQAKLAKKKWVELEMNISFRSSHKVLSLVDSVFNGIGIDMSHIPFRKEIGYVACLPLLEREQKECPDGYWEIPGLDSIAFSLCGVNSRSEESKCSKAYMSDKRHTINVNGKCYNIKIQEEEAAKILVSHIQSLLTDSPDLKPSDIMILIRKRSVLEDYLIGWLKSSGIPANTGTVRARDNLIIQDLISLAKFVCLPYDDLNLAGLLKSPFFGITEGELYDLAKDRGEDSLFVSISKRRSDLSAQLDYIRNLYNEYSLYDFYCQILYRHKKLDIFIERFGQYSIQIIEKFLSKILEYLASSQSAGMEYFIHWITELCENTIIANNQALAGDGVKIMTIHGAKGLQAKVVILADAAHSENLPPDLLLFYNEYMIYGAYENASDILNAVKAKNRRQRHEENLRLLYVALTRAEDKLYVFGSANRTAENSWYAILQNHMPMLPKPPENVVLDRKSQYIEKTKSKIFFDCATQTSLNVNNVSLKQKSKEAIRGEVIHQILYNLTKVSVILWERYTEKFIAVNTMLKIFSRDEKHEIFQIISETAKNFPDIIAARDSFAEISVIGKLNDLYALARVDKIIIRGDVIEIIEFKTGKIRSIDDIKEAYTGQLRKYQELLFPYFKKYKIKLKILSLSSQQMLEINISYKFYK